VYVFYNLITEMLPWDESRGSISNQTVGFSTKSGVDEPIQLWSPSRFP
jgi:hypothetical protein